MRAGTSRDPAEAERDPSPYVQRVPLRRVTRIDWALAGGGSSLASRQMNWPQRCAAVIPCLDEGATIATVVQAVRSFVPKVIVVDDGSSDDSGIGRP